MQAPELKHGSLRSRLVSNSAYSAAGYVIYLPVNLAVTSYVVHRLGLGPYGIWVLLTTLLGYGNLLDLGIRAPLVKYVAEYAALGRLGEINGLLSTIMVFYWVLGTLFL